MAAAEPPQFIYSFETKQQSVKPANNGSYISAATSSDPLFKWHNTGQRTARGQIVWRRATQRRKNPAYTAHTEAVMNNLAERMLASNFGTARQYKRGPNGRIVQVNVPEYAEYNASTRNALARAGIPNRARVGPIGLATSAAAAVPSNNNNNIAMAMGAMGLGKGGRTHKRRHTLRKKRRHTRRN